jgi:hypothetical protein
MQDATWRAWAPVERMQCGTLEGIGLTLSLTACSMAQVWRAGQLKGGQAKEGSCGHDWLRSCVWTPTYMCRAP